MRLGRTSNLRLWSAHSANHHTLVYAEIAAQARGYFAGQLPGLRGVNELATMRVRPATPIEVQVAGSKRVPFSLTPVFPVPRKNSNPPDDWTESADAPADSAANEILIRARLALWDHSIHDLAARASIQVGQTQVIYLETSTVLAFGTGPLPPRRSCVLAFTAGRYDPRFLSALK